MRYRNITLCIILGLLLCLSCKKDTEVNIDQFEITREEIVAGTNSATISGTYSYSGTINGITACISESGIHSKEFDAVLNGKNFAVEMTELRPGATYQYYYSVDYGFSKPFKTETKSFTTQSESPVVKTLEVLAIDSTTFRIKCDVLSGGGQEVTERGICWNTYGDPTMDDETLRHPDGGLGQYTIRMENLATNTIYYVRAYAKNAAGIGFGEELTFHTGGSATKPQVSTVEIMNVDYNSAQCLGNVSSDGGLAITERGVCWGLEPDPTINVHHAVAEGTTIGNYTVAMPGLSPNTTYHVRCYATNEKGTAYGEELTFMTTEGLPTVTTIGITEITSTNAKGGGEVTSEGASGVTERGLCWNTSGNPTIDDTHASNGTGAGSYTVSMTNLTPNETYYVRAYAKNTQGTSYGAEVSFTAKEGLPMVHTLDVTNVAATTAKGHGKVSDQGGSTVTERGLCWGIEPSPTIEGSHAQSGTGTGEYEISMTSLNPGTTYYVRAYAKNTQGLTYGEEKSFTTDATLPTVTTDGIEGTTAHGTVTADGGATVTERGICWSLNHNPTMADLHGTNGTGIGGYTVELTSLEPGKTYYYRAYATNSKGTAYGNEKSLTTEANLPTVTTGDVSNIQQTSAQGSGNVTDDGGATVTERGVCWSTSHEPTIANSHANNGTGIGSFTVNITGLTANTKYYVRAYATNSQGTSYGEEVSFKTSQNHSAPTVTTSQVTNVTQTTATGGGNVTSDGGAMVTERGICWSTSHNPTTSGSHANSGTGTGTYTVNMTGLTANTTYYVRAYAVNSEGTSYGSEVSFQTSATKPTVTTSQISNITSTTATGGGNVTDGGGANVTERGVCWSTSHNPTTSNSHTTNGTGTGSFTSSITGLTANTTYYVRAYATNSAGTAYGSEVTFTTSQNVTMPTVTTSQVTNITQTTATGGGNVTNSGGATVTERGICWSTSHNPSLSNGSHQQASSGGTGSFTVNMTGLTPGTTYYVRAYATNSEGTGYGTEVSFTTQQPYIITATANPTNGGTATVSGNGSFTYGQQCTLTATPANGYSFVRWTKNGTQVSTQNPYAFNVTETASFVAHFQANATIPTVTTSQVTNITQTTATGGGNVTSDGGATVTERGICWSTSQNPSLTNGSHQQASSGGTGSFTVPMTGLTPGTHYYVRAYATNSEGTGYGGQVEFDTQAQQYTISVSANPTNGGTVSGGGTYQQGQSCTVSVTANSNYTFTNWTENGNVASTQANYTFTVTGNRTLVANFTYNSVGGHAYVDLGLPSGTLWATCNVGADSPEDYGDYFAWGETQPKSDYSWSTYQYCMGDWNTITKYCYDSNWGYNGFTDNLTSLLPEDDAATANWGGGWRMPTMEELQELDQNTTNVFTTQNGVNGRLFTASNGNSIFLPAAGDRDGTSVYGVGSYGGYWSSSLNMVYVYQAKPLGFNSSNCYQFAGYRYVGLSVRAVCSTPQN